VSEGGGIEKSLLLQILSQLGEVGQQLGTLQAQAQHILQEQQHAAEGRAGIYARLGSVETVQGELASVVRRISPLVEKHETRYLQAEGVAWAWKILWAVFGAAVVGGIAWALSRLGWKP